MNLDFLSATKQFSDTPLLDGTNISSNADPHFLISYRSTDLIKEEHLESKAWREKLKQLLDELRELRRECRPVATTMEIRRLPAITHNGLPADLTYFEPFRYTSGSDSDIVKLVDKNRHPMFGLFPFFDVSGNPIQNSANEPFAFQLGYSSSFYFYFKAKTAGDRRENHSTRLFDLIEECGRLLSTLPWQAISSIWGKSHIIKTHESNESRWIESVFRFLWQPARKNHRLQRHVYDENGTHSIVLDGNGFFPRMPKGSFSKSFFDKIPTEAGYPFSWCSTIDG